MPEFIPVQEFSIFNALFWIEPACFFISSSFASCARASVSFSSAVAIRSAPLRFAAVSAAVRRSAPNIVSVPAALPDVERVAFAADRG
jgi:hypothetical protein